MGDGNTYFSSDEANSRVLSTAEGAAASKVGVFPDILIKRFLFPY